MVQLADGAGSTSGGWRSSPRRATRSTAGSRCRDAVPGRPSTASRSTRWVTRSAEASLRDTNGQRHLSLRREAHGRWFSGEEEVEACRGALDVDLGLTPSTNTSVTSPARAARRRPAEPTAAWVRFPELSVEPLLQRYSRLDETTYLYESLREARVAFHARLEVDPTGLVERYERLFERVDGSAPGQARPPMNVYALVLALIVLVLLSVSISQVRKTQTKADYLVAGRSLPWYILVFTLLSSWIGSGCLFAGAENAFRNGFAALWQAAGGWCGLLVIYFIAPRARKFAQFTIPDLLETRYNIAARVLGAMAILFAFTAIAWYQFKGGGDILHIIFPASTSPRARPSASPRATSTRWGWRSSRSSSSSSPRSPAWPRSPTWTW